MADVTDIPTEDLRALFDIAVGSLNFTSGFLDSEETEVLRRVAVAIGVDPMVGTPSEFATQYPHAFRAREDVAPVLIRLQRNPCHWCNQPEARHPDQLQRRP